MYNDNARSWAVDIKNLSEKTRLLKLDSEKLSKRLEKAKSFKKQKELSELLNDLLKVIEENDNSIKKETNNFFEEILGISNGNIIQKVIKGVPCKQKVLAEILSVTTLTNETIVLSVIGAQIAEDAFTKELSCTSLIASESLGEILKSLD